MIAHHQQDQQERQNPFWPLKIALFFGIFFFAAELIVAFFSHSIAVLGDSLHNLSHTGVLVFSILGLSLARKPPTKKMTYGLRRLETLVPAANIVFLAVIGTLLLEEGRFRLGANPEISGMPILIVSSLDIASNIIVAALMRKSWKNLTVKTVAVHLLFDALASFGVIFGGIAIVLWGWYQADAWAAIFIGALALVSAAALLLKIGQILMEGSPSNLSLDEVSANLMAHDAVLAIEDLHIWGVGEKNYLTAHLILQPAILKTGDELDEFVEELSHDLKHKFLISHVTIQPEFRMLEPEEH